MRTHRRIIYFLSILLITLISLLNFFNCNSKKNENTQNNLKDQDLSNTATKNYLPIVIPNSCRLEMENWLEGEGLNNYPGGPIGGGNGYSNTINRNEADYIVYDNNIVKIWDTNEEIYIDYDKSFIYLLTHATDKNNDNKKVIYIDDNAVIDLTNLYDLYIEKGITLASGRGKDDSSGAIIKTDHFGISENWNEETQSGSEIHNFFIISNSSPSDKVRITGIRLIGPDPMIRDNTYKYILYRGITCVNSNYIEVDNCELTGWSHAAIYLNNTKDNQNSDFKNIHVHHNTIHHNQRLDLGYGVCLAGESNALIEANLFDSNRHAISATGEPELSYEARFNLVLWTQIMHSFDMHQNGDTGIAGKLIRIHHNLFLNTETTVNSGTSVKIRATPTVGAFIYNNKFAEGKAAIYQYEGDNNCYRGPNTGYAKCNDYSNVKPDANEYFYRNADCCDPHPCRKTSCCADFPCECFIE